MYIEPFAVEQWMNTYETRCRWNLAETCVESLSVAELLSLCGQDADALQALLPLRLGYGAIEGSDRLRAAISRLYADTALSQVVVTHGTIGANMLVHRALVEPGDTVIAIVPSYQQHYSIPASIGAEVHKHWLREENGYLPDLDDLARQITPATKLIAMTNPNNPTGALMDRPMLEAIAELARTVGAWVLCDEVYRGTDQQPPGMTASIVDLYERGISTAGMSKAFSLAGLRLGWIVGPTHLLDAVSVHRDYDTISVGVIDDYLASLALEHQDRLLKRSCTITRANHATLSNWMTKQPGLSWVPPRSGTTALLRYEHSTPSEMLCRSLLEATGVLLMPGAALGMEGQLRIGYANNSTILAEGLNQASAFLAKAR